MYRRETDLLSHDNRFLCITEPADAGSVTSFSSPSDCQDQQQVRLGGEPVALALPLCLGEKGGAPSRLCLPALCPASEDLCLQL